MDNHRLTTVVESISFGFWISARKINQSANFPFQARENELRAQRNEAKESERIRLEEKRKLAEENEEKQNRAQGQVVLDPKKQKKYEAQEARRKRKMARKKNKPKA